MLTACAVQCDIAWESPAVNQRSAAETIARSAPPERALVLLPELFDTGFSLSLEVVARAGTEAWAASVANAHRIHLCAGHGAIGPDDRGLNCASVFAPDGRFLGRYEKMHPFGIGGETRAYSAGRALHLFEVGSMQVCPLICYDLRFPELWRLAALAGAEVFVIGANWPAARQHHWRSLCIARAIENQAYVVAANRVGRDPSLLYGGGSLIVSPRGEVLAEAGDGEAVLSANLDPEAVRSWRRDFPALRDIRGELLGDVQVRR